MVRATDPNRGTDSIRRRQRCLDRHIGFHLRQHSGGGSARRNAGWSLRLCDAGKWLGQHDSDRETDGFGRRTQRSVRQLSFDQWWDDCRRGAGANGINTQAGAAYVFTEQAGGWGNMTQTAKLTASDGASFDQLGLAAAVNGGTVVAGATAAMGRIAHTGAAYVYAE